MFSSTLKERYRWLFRLGSGVLCSLQSLLRMTALSYTILSVTVSTNNLPDKTLTFLPFCQMFGPAAAAVVPAIPGDADENCCQSRAIQNSSGTIDRHQKGLWKGTRPFAGHCQQITHTNQWTHACLCEGFLCSACWYTYPNITPLIWRNHFDFVSAVVQHLRLCDHNEIGHLCRSSLHTLLYRVEPVDLFRPSVHMLRVTRRCDDRRAQLVDGGEPLTPAATQTGCMLEGEEGECCEAVMVMEEVGVSKGIVCPDTMPSYRTVGYDLNPHAVH